MNIENQQVSQRDVANAAKVPAWLQFAFIKTSEAIKYNSAYGFVTEKEINGEDFQNVKEDLKAQQGKMVLVSKVKNGYIIELPFNVMPKVFTTVIPDFPHAAIEKYLSENQKTYKKDKEDCGKFIDRIIAGKQTEDETFKGFACYNFGLYCINQTNAIKDKETMYKAYKMSVESLKKILQARGVLGKFYITDGVSMPIPLNERSAVSLMNIADSGNGVVFKLCVRA